MCVNDIVCCGAKPLLFLDYIACGKNQPEKIASIVSGVAEGCVQAGCVLNGGETAEMPGFYDAEEYDLAGFSVGAVEKEKILNSENVCAGDVLIALPSSGVHSNGFSLVRKIFEVEKPGMLEQYSAELGKTLGETLLTPTKIYVKPALSVLEQGKVKSICHITGGGFYENIPRMLPNGVNAQIRKDSYPILPIFRLLQKTGNLEEKMMYNTYNMGLGMVLAVEKEDTEKVMEAVRAAGETPYHIGEVIAGEKGVTLC